MDYGAVQDRALTEDVDQYLFHRRENALIFRYLKKFPLMPASLEINYIDQWDFHSFDLHYQLSITHYQLFYQAYLHQ